MTTESPGRDFDLLKSLEVFLSVAETGSMTAAAGRLRITQSAISQQIKLLETDLGAPLLYRDVRPLRLTPAGVTLQNRAGSLLVAARQMRSDVRQVAAGRLPHLRVAMLSTFARTLVPVILQAVRSKTLAVDNITITRGLTMNHAQDLAHREIDVAFTSDVFDAAADLEHLELVRESYLLVTPSGFSPRTDDMLRLNRSLPFLRYSTRTQSGQRVEAHLRRMRLDLTRSAVFEAAGDLIGGISSGYGWSILTPSQLLDALQSGAKLEVRAMPKPGLSRTIGLVWRTGEMADTMRQLIALCVRVLRQDTLPRLETLMPDLAGYFEILPDLEDGVAPTRE